MPDPDLVIRGLEHCMERGYLSGHNCNGYRKDCPYGQYEAGCVEALLNDVNAMLREQEPKPVRIGRFPEDKPFSHCPKCGLVLDAFIHYPSQLRPSYCPICGQAIKWD